MELFCSNCRERKPETEFTKFARNPSLADRNGYVILCKNCCSKLCEEMGNTIEALKNVLRLVDIPYVEKFAQSALEKFKKKRENTNLIIKRNLYNEKEEVTDIETDKRQETLYTCYTSSLGLLPKRYTNYSFSDGIRDEDEDLIQEYQEKKKENTLEKAIKSAEKFFIKMYGEEIYNDKERFAKAVKLTIDECGLHKNNVNKRQLKFRIKTHISNLIEGGILSKKDYAFLFDDENTENNENEKTKETKDIDVIVQNNTITFKVPPSMNLEQLADKWGYGYTPEQLYAFEKKYQMLKNNYPEKTALHTEGLLTYIRYRVNEEMATARGDVKSAKDWGELASKQATNAKINVAQLSRSDLSDGLDSFGTLVKAIEAAVDAIAILPKFKEKPQDSVDFTLWCYINYARDLKGLPPADYKDIYAFYETRKKEYEKRFGSLSGTDENKEGDDANG